MMLKQRFGRKALVGGLTATMALSVFATGTITSHVQAASSTPFIEGWWAWPPLGVLNPFSPNAINLVGFANSPLAYYTQDNNSYIPEVAASWQMVAKPGDASNGTLTIHIRKGAKFSDGSPITSVDVKMSIELGYILNTQVSSYIKSVTTPDANTVVVKQNDKNFNLFAQQILTVWIYPSKLWAQYLPKNLQQMYLTSQGTGKDAAKVADTLSKIAKKLGSVNVKNYVGAGPFKVTQVTSSQITMDKNENWWGASRVNVPQFVLLAENGNTQAYSYALSQRVDYNSTYAPPTVVDPFLAKPNDYIAGPDGNGGPGLYLNTSVKPFNDIRVRQAFAYVIDRQEVEQIAYPVGTSSVKAATPTQYPTGLPTANYKWLTAETKSKLNPYKKDLNKAAKLLASAGLKKVSGSWQYNGKPLKVQVACPGAYTDWVAIAENVATQLSQFGIDAKTQTVDVTTYFTKLPKGDYATAIGFVGSSNLAPWYDYGSIMGGEGLTINSSGKISRLKTSYNWGPVVPVSGQGNINVVKLWDQLVNTTDVSKEKVAVNKLALAINEQLPVIDLLYNKFYAIFYNTNRWTGYPSASNPLWDPNISGGSAALMFIEQGYLKPAH